MECYAMNNKSIRKAVKLWFEDKQKCIETYGHISDWNTSKVTNMDSLFRCKNFDKNLSEDYFSKWDTSSVKDMSFMFACSRYFNLPVPFNTSSVTSMGLMFCGCTFFDQPVNFDTSKVTSMYSMFSECKSFNQPVDFKTSNVIYMSHMFCNCWKFNQPIKFDTKNVTNMSYMFCTCVELNQLIYLNTTNVNDMSLMFNDCRQMEHPIDHFITSKYIKIDRFGTNVPSYEKLKTQLNKAKQIRIEKKLKREGIDINMSNESRTLRSHKKQLRPRQCTT